MNEADRELHGFRWKWRLANTRSSMVHENDTDYACMDEIKRTKRKNSVQATSHQLSCFVKIV